MGGKIHFVGHYKNSYWIMLSDEFMAVTIAYTQPSSNMCHYLERPIGQRRILSTPNSSYDSYNCALTSQRGVGMFVFRALKNVMKIRYLILGGAISGGMTLQKTYQEWVDALPDISWIDRYLPKKAEFESIRTSLTSFTEKLKELEIDPQLREVAETKLQSMKDWFDTKLEEAYTAAGEQEIDNSANSVKNVVTLSALSFRRSESVGQNEKSADTKSGSSVSEEELWEIQMKYQKELERLERENKELRKQILLRRSSNQQQGKKIKASLIDMYSDVLDELTDYDTNYKTQDHLPRVVVIGDQSSGKTSVLEMIAQARIFPRGAGEMMTRSPVKVTLSEGPYHIAQFKDSSREFDLSKESDLEDLRLEVELRMRNVVKKGKTVSNDVISMTVKGPGLQRMVLVDLPGIISTKTIGMADDTKDAIYQIAKYYMSNPNAIILCIQDGSVDAERSNVTDLVAQMDPQGKRTIFVLTKVDLAEKNLTNPNRIKQILAGELFPMKALGYFAVITGRGVKNESIQQIKQYEDEFFRTSKLFNNKVIKSTQMTTRNLSLAVSECFWKMVKESVEQQADAFKAQRFNLETEWKNTFPRQRIMDRNELFDKARSEILDEVINLSEVSINSWEDSLTDKLWTKISDFVFENIYFPATDQTHQDFNTKVDIELYQWAAQALPQISIEAGWETLQQQFKQLIYENKMRKDHDDIFDTVKAAVVEEALHRHNWEEKAVGVLRVIQLNTLTDQIITDKPQWDSAVRFLDSFVKQKLQNIENELNTMMGPSALEKWCYWKYTSEQEKKRNEVKNELNKILSTNADHSSVLSEDELVTVTNTLQRSDIICNNDFVNETWSLLYKKHFLKLTLDKVPYYMKGFFLYQQGVDPQDYNEVIFFWRIQQMLKVTVNSLRQQIVNREAHRLDEEIKEVLEDFGRDQSKKEQLLTGRRVTLAEELKRVKQIQEKLEDFIKALNKEKLEIRRTS